MKTVAVIMRDTNAAPLSPPKHPGWKLEAGSKKQDNATCTFATNSEAHSSQSPQIAPLLSSRSGADIHANRNHGRQRSDQRVRSGVQEWEVNRRRWRARGEPGN